MSAAHAAYCDQRYSGLTKSRGSSRAMALHKAIYPMKRPLRRTKKKKASPTLP